MSSWATITLDMMDEDDVRGRKEIPAQFLIDNGIDERGWVEEEERFFALSNGRYQHLALLEHAKQMHSPWYSGVAQAAVAEVENTGDTVTVHALRPKQKSYDDRRDGFFVWEEYDGKRWSKEEREALKERVEENHGFKPRIEPMKTTTPPDMMMEVSEDSE